MLVCLRPGLPGGTDRRLPPPSAPGGLHRNRLTPLTRACAIPCRSGLVSRKGRAAAPAIFDAKLKSWGRYAPLSRHKAAPTGTAQVLKGWDVSAALRNHQTEG
ncbi:hypothetical protein CQW31_03460 [Pseudomonas sp. 382]|nr:hypothetical protein DZC31_26030 [Stenotrophomonas rhizophila]PIK79856.1 hypothetical protein CQW31_03460 [Pseudomonas sp. 382]